MSGSRQKMRAILLSFVMVTSIMVAGVAFTGTAAAAPSGEDTSGPSISSVEADNEGGNDKIYVVFDEPVYANQDRSGALTASNFTYNDNSGGDASSITSVDHNAGERVALLTTDNTVASGDTSSDTIAAASSSDYFDGAGNGADTSTSTVSNNAVSIVDVEAEGETDKATVIFSEGVGQETAQTSDLSTTEISASGGSNPTVSSVDHTAGTATLGGATAEVTFSSSIPGSDIGTAAIDISSTDDGVQDDDSSDTIAGTSATFSDTTEPFITSTTLKDTDGDGTLNTIDVTLSEPVGDNSNTGSGVFTLSDGSADGVAAITEGDQTVTINSLSGSPDTSPKDLTLNNNQIEDTQGSGQAIGNSQTLSGLDDAPPVISSAVTADNNDDGFVDTITVTFSEDIDTSASTLNTDTFNLGSGDVDGVTDNNADDSDVTLSVSSVTGSIDTSVTPNVILKTGDGSVDVFDSAGNTASSDITFSSTSDGAEPIMAAAETSGTNSDGDINQITVDYSEDVTNTPASASNFALSTGSVSSTSTVDASTDTLSVAGISGSSATPDVTLDSAETLEDTGTNNQQGDTLTVTSTNGVSATLQGDGNSDIKTEIGGQSSQTLRAGSAQQDLGLIKIRDVSGGDSPLAQRTILSMPDGVTINESASDLLVTTTSGDLDVTNTEVQDGGSTLRLEHSGSSEGSQTIRIGGASVDTAADVDASQSGNGLDINVDYATRNLDTELLTLEKPQIQTGTSEDVSAGTESQNLDDSIGTITIQTGSNVAGQIANNTNIVLNANESNGITFDTDIDPTTITATANGNAEVDMSEATLTQTALTIPVTSHFAAGNKLDIDTSTGDKLLVDVAGDATNAKLSGTVVANDTTGDVALQQSGQAEDVNVQNPDVNIEESGQQLAVGLNEQLLAEGSALSSGTAIEVEDTAGDQIAAGENVTIQLNSSAVTFDTSRDTNVIQDGSSVSTAGDDATLDVALNNDGNIDVDAITVNENTIEVSIVADGRSSTNSGDTLELGDVGLNVSTTAEDGAAVEFETLTRSGSSAPDVTSVSTDDKNSGGPTSNQFVTVNRPDFELNGNDNQNIDTGQSENITVPLDGDGFEQRSESGGDDALVISSDVAGQIADNTNVTIQLEQNTGVTFDTRSAGSTGANNDDTSTDVQVNDGDLSATNIVVNEKSIDIVLADDTSGGSGPDAHLDTGTSNEIVIDDLVLNGTSDASNTEISVITNATVSSPDGTSVLAGSGGGTFTSTANNEVTTTLGNIIVLNENTPDSVFVSGDISTDDGGEVRSVNGVDYAVADGGEDSTSVAVGSGVDSSVFVENSTSTEAFGGADVSLDVVQQPDSEDFTAGDLLNTTSLSTASDGTADLNFTAPSDAVTGTYKINASTSAGGENITYSVTPGDASQFNVSSFDNAVIDESGLSGSPGETEIAAVKVRIEDAGGNLVSDQFVDVAVQVDNGELQTVNDDISAGAPNGNTLADEDNNDRRDYNPTTNDLDPDSDSGNDDNGQNGEFFVFVSSTSPGNVNVTVSEGGVSDTGTATVFDAVDSVAVEPESSSIAPGDSVNVTATAQTSDGTTVEVPRLTRNDLTSDNQTVLQRTSVSEEANGGTFANGTIEATFDAQSVNGTANVTANIAGATGDATITVEEDAPAYYTLKLSNSIADRDVHAAIISTFSTHRQSGSTALLPHSVYRYTRTHTGGQR